VRRAVAGKARVSAIAKELGQSSRDVIAKLNELGEFVKSASSTIEAPVVGAMRGAGELVAGGAVRAAGATKVVPASTDGTGADGRATGGAGRGVTTDGVDGGVGAAGAAGAAGVCAATDGRPGVPPGRPGWAARVGVDPLAGTLPFGGVAGKASRNLRTTGASMVEDGDLTNSPRS